MQLFRNLNALIVLAQYAVMRGKRRVGQNLYKLSLAAQQQRAHPSRPRRVAVVKAAAVAAAIGADVVIQAEARPFRLAHRVKGQPHMVAVGRFVLCKARVPADAGDDATGQLLHVVIDLQRIGHKLLRQRIERLFDVLLIVFMCGQEILAVIVERDAHEIFQHCRLNARKTRLRQVSSSLTMNRLYYTLTSVFFQRMIRFS